MLFALILNSLLSLTARADIYEFKITSTDPSDIVQAKNCLDYSFCGDSKMTITRSKKANGATLYQSKLRASVPSTTEYAFLYERCSLYSENATVEVFNKTIGLPVAAPGHNTNTRDIKNMYRNIFIKKLSTADQQKFYSDAEALIRKKKFQDALNLVIRTFELDTSGYTLAASKKVDRYHATTTHETKKIAIGSSFLETPCDLVQVVRHELEHAFQMTRVNYCESKGKKHGLEDHIAREQSAYLNDLYSFPLYCPTPKKTKELEENAIFQLFDRYTKVATPAAKK